VSGRYTVIIPARMASSRYPGKPLVEILGLPLVEHVRRRALLADGVGDVIVATCDTSIIDAIRGFGGQAVMTADTHERCTDRVEEATRTLADDIIVMVQGDEPLLMPDAVSRVAQPLVDDPAIICTNLLSPLESDADLDNPNIVKAMCDQAGRILFFSRAHVPFPRKAVPVPVYRQSGIMAFRGALLRKYATLSETPFERAESVDMLRLLEHGLPIHSVVVDYPTVGVDRPQDVAVVERYLMENPVQRDLHSRIMAATR
jgi:3-deoxy-manno-octulosonate cytidylyltransferase (CMP-KDO synthetase)